MNIVLTIIVFCILYGATSTLSTRIEELEEFKRVTEVKLSRLQNKERLY